MSGMRGLSLAIVEGDKEGWGVLSWREHARALLATVIHSADITARGRAIELVHSPAGVGIRNFAIFSRQICRANYADLKSLGRLVLPPRLQGIQMSEESMAQSAGQLFLAGLDSVLGENPEAPYCANATCQFAHLSNARMNVPMRCEPGGGSHCRRLSPRAWRSGLEPEGYHPSSYFFHQTRRGRSTLRSSSLRLSATRSPSP
jgi:hypothetical protein